MGTYIIYGAGVVAYQTMVAIKKCYDAEPVCFLVTERTDNIDEIAGIPVVSVLQMQTEWKMLPVVIATPEVYHQAIVEELQKLEVQSYHCIDTHAEYCLMKEYFKQIGQFEMAEDLLVDNAISQVSNRRMVEQQKEKLQPAVFMAKSHRDKLLQKQYDIPDWVHPVQAGRACTDVDLGVLADCDGENISAKNPNYCELTVSYWAWKNRKDAYKGICHYRRMLLLSEDVWQNCIAADVDMILPLPFVCFPDATGQYKRYISEQDREGLVKALAEVSPDYLQVLEELDKQPYFYNYNMLIAKREVFDDYAWWLFNVLFCAEKYCEPAGTERRDRYAGYLGELLTTLYIMKKRNVLRMVHVEKSWMV